MLEVGPRLQLQGISFTFRRKYIVHDAADDPSRSQFKPDVKDMFATSTGRYAKAAWRHAIAAVPEVNVLRLFATKVSFCSR
jgi:hypothetical protein